MVDGIILAFNPLKAKLNPICHLLALLGTHPIFHVSRLRVKGLMGSVVSAGRFRWLRSLRRESTAVCLLELRVQIHPRARMSVCCE